MGNELDTILKKIVLEGPHAVNADYLGDKINIQGREAAFGIQLDFSNGVSTDMNLYLQGSLDGVIYVDITDAQNITDPSGTHLWDIIETGMSFVRVRIEVIAGSLDIDRIYFSGKRRH